MTYFCLKYVHTDPNYISVLSVLQDVRFGRDDITRFAQIVGLIITAHA